MKAKAIYFATAIFLLILDQAVKAYIRGNFHPHEVVAVWPGIFEITLTYNEGIAFGQLQGAGIYLAPIAILITGYATWHVFKHPKDSAWAHFAMGALAAGAIGNLIDRIAFRRVTDMFWLRGIDFPVFNVADAAITVAGTILVIRWGMEAFQKPAPVVAVALEGQSPGFSLTSPGAEGAEETKG